LISSLADNVKNMSRIVDEMGTLSSKLVKDYDYISEQIKFVITAISSFAKKVLVPLTGILGIFGKLGKFNPLKRKSSEADAEQTEAEEDEF